MQTQIKYILDVPPMWALNLCCCQETKCFAHYIKTLKASYPFRSSKISSNNCEILISGCFQKYSMEGTLSVYHLVMHIMLQAFIIVRCKPCQPSHPNNSLLGWVPKRPLQINLRRFWPCKLWVAGTFWFTYISMLNDCCFYLPQRTQRMNNFYCITVNISLNIIFLMQSQVDVFAIL